MTNIFNDLYPNDHYLNWLKDYGLYDKKKRVINPFTMGFGLSMKSIDDIINDFNQSKNLTEENIAGLSKAFSIIKDVLKYDPKYVKSENKHTLIHRNGNKTHINRYLTPKQDVYFDIEIDDSQHNLRFNLKGKCRSCPDSVNPMDYDIVEIKKGWV
jgi:hypothetical protein